MACCLSLARWCPLLSDFCSLPVSFVPVVVWLGEMATCCYLVRQRLDVVATGAVPALISTLVVWFPHFVVVTAVMTGGVAASFVNGLPFTTVVP